jgi:hypothetical protein
MNTKLFERGPGGECEKATEHNTTLRCHVENTLKSAIIAMAGRETKRRRQAWLD